MENNTESSREKNPPNSPLPTQATPSSGEVPPQDSSQQETAAVLAPPSLKPVERWELLIKTFTVLLSAVGFLWGLNTYWVSRQADRDQRERELTKPYREAQLRMCEELTTANSIATDRVLSLMFSKEAGVLRDHASEGITQKSAQETLRTESHKVAAEVNKFVSQTAMLGDADLPMLQVRFRNAAARCVDFNTNYLNADGGMTVYSGSGEPQKEWKLRPGVCLYCLPYLSLKVGEHCGSIVKVWWVPDLKVADDGPSAASKREMTSDELYWCEHSGEVTYPA